MPKPSRSRRPADFQITPEALAAAKGGDRDMIARIVRHCEPLVQAVANGFTAGRPDVEADDLLQDGAMVVMRCIDRYDPGRGESTFENYITVAVTNQFRDGANKRKVHLRLAFVPTEDLDERVAKTSHRERLEALAALSPAEARVLQLRYAGVPDGEQPLGLRLVADAMGVSLKKATDLHTSAVAALRRGMGEGE